MLDPIILENLRKAKELRKKEKLEQEKTKREKTEREEKEKSERKKKRQRITQEKIEKIIEMLENGYTFDEISKQLNVSHITIVRIKRAYNVQKGYRLKLQSRKQGHIVVTIPKEYLEKFNLKKGDYVFMRVEKVNGKPAMVIIPWRDYCQLRD